MDFPRTLDEITPEWLTHVLRENGHIETSTVRDVSVELLAGGHTGSVVRAVLSYEISELNAPESIVIKIPTSDEQARTTVAALGMYEQEYRFYRELAPTAGMDVAKHYFVETDSTGTVGVIGLEDLGHLRNSSLGELIILNDSIAAIRAMAAMHAKWWNNPKLLNYSWLFHPGVLPNDTTVEHLAAGCEKAASRYGHLLSDGTKAFLAALPGGVPKIEKSWGEGNTTLCMGDSRGANWFFGGSGDATRAIAIDWQSPARYSGANDIAYFMVLSMPLADRRLRERELIDAYYSELMERGVVGYSADQLEDDIRWGMFKSLITTARVLGGFEVPEELVLNVDERLNALYDWECLELIT